MVLEGGGTLQDRRGRELLVLSSSVLASALTDSVTLRNHLTASSVLVRRWKGRGLFQKK